VFRTYHPRVLTLQAWTVRLTCFSPCTSRILLACTSQCICIQSRCMGPAGEVAGRSAAGSKGLYVVSLHFSRSSLLMYTASDWRPPKLITVWWDRQEHRVATQLVNLSPIALWPATPRFKSTILSLPLSLRPALLFLAHTGVQHVVDSRRPASLVTPLTSFSTFQAATTTVGGTVQHRH
jgi:hypothetical protein